MRSITAVKALNELTNMGYLYRTKGKGTFLSKSKISQIVKFTDIEFHSHESEYVEVLSIVEENNKLILTELQLDDNSSYYKIERIKEADGVPFIYHITHIPKKINERADRRR